MMSGLAESKSTIAQSYHIKMRGYLKDHSVSHDSILELMILDCKSPELQ